MNCWSLPLTPCVWSAALPTIPATATTRVRFWLAEHPAPSVALIFSEYVPAGVSPRLVNVIAALELPLCCETLETVPAGSPLRAKVTDPEFPVTFAVIFAGVPSWGANAMEEERERLRVPGPPELLPLLHPVIARQRGASQQNTIRKRVCLGRSISTGAQQNVV